MHIWRTGCDNQLQVYDQRQRTDRLNFILPQGSYRIRADYDGVPFWSGSENTCTLPGCESAAVTLPCGLTETNVTIEYIYDPLYRLTAADYSDSKYHHITPSRLTEAGREPPKLIRQWR